jgi:hypothetical protein
MASTLASRSSVEEADQEGTGEDDVNDLDPFSDSDD